MSNFYVTTSIPYVNSEPHIGFGMELVLADVIARYMRKSKIPVIYCTGTDEHGGKIAEKAVEAQLEPQVYVDQISQSFRELLPLLNISNDKFIRTTDPAHERIAQIIWNNLNPYIYKGRYSGWYCTGDEAFFTEEVVKQNKGVCPAHNRAYEKIEEENYFFKLSAFTLKIKEVIDKGNLQIVPESRKNEILSLIKGGLDDISISRPKNKIAWGIAVPGDTTQVMYVWFEALMNYITAIGYPDQQQFKDFWPASVQVIGKDILRFHAAIWPAMLIGLGLPVQKLLYVHGFITLDDKKISKSLGNVVAPKEIVDKYGADTFRYFFLRHIPSYEDGDFSWTKIETAYNSELADQLGNAVSRTAALIAKFQKGVIGEIPVAEHDVDSYHKALESCRFDKALDEVWDQVRGLNQYIDQEKPWQLAKQGEEEHLQEVLAYMVGALLEIGQLLEPFMPETSEKIAHLFGSGVLQALPTSLFPKHDTSSVASA